jgi:hypothetical protein
MKWLRDGFMLITLLILSSFSMANAAKQQYPDSPLLDGTKVVAGHQKDEFFIVADNDVYKVDEPPIRPPSNTATKTEKPIIVATNKNSKPIRVAANADAHQTAQAIKAALNKIAEQKKSVVTYQPNPQAKIALKKDNKKLALAKPVSQASLRKSVLAIEMALSFSRPRSHRSKNF